MNPTLDQGKYAFLTSAQKAQANADYQKSLVVAATATTAPKTIKDLGYASPDTLEEEGFRSEMGIASSSKGADIVNTARTTEAKMTPPLATTKTSTAKTGSATPIDNSMTFINPNTGQTATIGDPSINKEVIQNLLSSGYMMQDAKGSVPSWLQQKSDGTSSVSTQSTEQEAFQNIKTQADSDVIKLRNFEYEMANDPVLAGILSNVSSQWESRIAEAERSNNSRNAAMTTAGLRLGSRYAGGSVGPMAGIISSEERAGIGRIGDLLNQKNAALAEARSAYESKKWDRYVKLVEISEKKLAESKQAMADLNKITVAENKKIREREQQVSRDSGIAELLMGGATEREILSTGDYTAEELKKVTDSLAVSGNGKNLSADLNSFEYLKKSNLLPKSILSLPDGQQYFAYLNLNKLAESGKLSAAGLAVGGGDGAGLTPGKGAKNTTEEQILRMRLFAKLSTILNKGQLSDSDRTVINENISTLRAAGLSEQDIMSQLAGFPSDVKTPYNSQFIDVITANTDTNEKQQVLMGKVGQLLASGSYEGALNTIENTAMTNAKSLVSDNFVNLADVQYVQKKVNEIEGLLGEGWNNEVGKFTGSFNSWLSKTFGFGQAVKIRAKLTSLTSDLISKRAGSALTETEWEKLVAGSVPVFNESAKTWNTKLTELVENPLTRLNTIRGMVTLPELTADSINDADMRLDLYGLDGEEGEDFWGGTGEGGNQIYQEGTGYVLPQVTK